MQPFPREGADVTYITLALAPCLLHIKDKEVRKTAIRISDG
jgi:hypothetical protein